MPQVDATSKAGLYGLTQTLLRRTSVDVGDPVMVDVEADELSFYPFLYWPVTAGQRTPTPEAIEKLNHYLAVGGMILFDTADQNLVGMTGRRSGPGRAAPDGADAGPRRAAPDADPARPCADQVVLSAARLPGPLDRRNALGRSAARPRQ